MTNTIADIETADVILVTGSNTTENHPVLSSFVKRAVLKGAKLIVVDPRRIKLVEQLSRLVTESGNGPYPILLQVNAGNDPAKYGCAVEEAESLLEAALAAPGLRVEGLMTIAPLDESREVARRCFARLREVREQLQAASGHPLPELSMGMSGDLEEAIVEGSTLIRVGSALFGSR